MSGDSSWLVNFHNISSGIRKNGVLQKMCNNNSGKIMHSSPDEVEVLREKKSKKIKKLHIMQDIPQTPTEIWKGFGQSDNWCQSIVTVHKKQTIKILAVLKTVRNA